MEPVIKALEKDYGKNMTFVIADIDNAEGRTLADRYGITLLPTMIFIDGKGNEKERVEGAKSREFLESRIKGLISGTTPAEQGFFTGGLSRYLEEISLITFIAAFLGGLATSISPCIIAMLPVMVGYIGGYSQPSRARGFSLSLIFVLGLATTFALLGMGAAWVGGIFGNIGTGWYYIVAAVAIIMGLQLTGVLQINFPVLSKLPWQGQGYLASYIMGLLFGLVASPCATPVLAVLVTFAAGTGNILMGGLLLFLYGLGHGIPLLAAGTFTAYIKSFQRFRQVGAYITVVSGVLLIAVGYYFLYLARN